MFKKILVANRGEIAVRVVRSCRDMGITTVAICDPADRGSLHMRLADECALLPADSSFLDQAAILEIARRSGADAIHPGYGFLAERPEFIAACEQAGITFIGPSSEVVATMHNKPAVLARVRAAGFDVPAHTDEPIEPDDAERLAAEAERIGYPLVIKSLRSGRGRGTRLVRTPNQLATAAHEAYAESQAVYGPGPLYLERAVLPSRHIEVPVLADHHGTIVHLGDRDGSLLRNNHKLIEESPAPYLSAEQRMAAYAAAVQIIQLLGCRGACTVDFLIDADGRMYFTEVKARLQVEHPVTEVVTRVDEVREQIRIAAGERLGFTQEQVRVEGYAIQCRINAENPWNRSLPSPGRLAFFRQPGGVGVRVDTHAFAGYEIPVQYDPLLAKLVVWGATRAECILRARRALEEFAIGGVHTNLPMIQRMLAHPVFEAAGYDTEFCREAVLDTPADERDLRDLAAVVALAYVARNQAFRPEPLPRRDSGWHRDSRRLPV